MYECQQKICLIGSGGNAKVILDMLYLKACYQIEGFFDKEEKKFADLSYLGIDADCRKYKEKALFVNTVGSIKTTNLRKEIFLFYQNQNCRFPPIIHPTAYIAQSVFLDEGTLIFAMSILQVNCKIGQNVLINHRCVIDHDCQIGDHTHVAPGCIIGGNVTIGKNCHIGSGTIILQNIQIGDNVTIGAGSLVNKNITSNALAFGTPCQIRKYYD